MDSASDNVVRKSKPIHEADVDAISSTSHNYDVKNTPDGNDVIIQDICLVKRRGHRAIYDAANTSTSLILLNNTNKQVHHILYRYTYLGHILKIPIYRVQ